MTVSEKDVLYVAELANLELTADERARMLRDLNSILDYIKRLNELDTTEVPPMTSVPQSVSADQPAFRGDAPHEPLGREAGLRNAPESDGVFFKVPKVIER